MRSVCHPKNAMTNNHHIRRSRIVGRPRITPSVNCLAPDAFSGAKLQVLMENGQKNEIDQGLGAPDWI